MTTMAVGARLRRVPSASPSTSSAEATMTEREPLPTRADYPVLYEIPTRWLDNDIYGHVNNVNYYSFFDTAIANYLIGEGGLDPWRDQVVGYCVESGCRFHRGIRFPDRITAGLRVASSADRASATRSASFVATSRRPRGRPLRPRLRRPRRRAIRAGSPRDPGRSARLMAAPEQASS